MKSTLIWRLSRTRSALFAGLLLLAAVPRATPAADPAKAEFFPLADVRLLDGPFLEAQRRNERYLLSLDADRFLHTFRVNVGLPSTAAPYGGWEEPRVEVRGHSLGHYLSALARAAQSSGDAQFCERANRLVAELAKCQDAATSAGFNPGYLAAFPESFFDRVEARQPVWVPWYTLHKIMAGLLDVHQACGNAQALAVLEKLAGWVKFRVGRLTRAQMQASLDTEFGGMNEVLANLAALTGKADYLQLARAFDHARVFDPLAKGEDRLDGLHANTQIPKIIGAAREYELTGDLRDRDIARTFWQSVARERSYVIGGHSDHEHFFPPAQFSRHLSPETAETCNTYNLLKLTRHLWAWEPSVPAMDFYERALFNHILAAQDPETGMFVYFLSLKPGHFKTYSQPDDSFWCCVGTGMENPTKYAESIFAHSADALFVNLFIPAELSWRERGIVVRQETTFPAADRSTLTLRCAAPATLTLNLRKPEWAGRGYEVTVNGPRQDVTGASGGYVAVTREWRDGDRVQVRLPMALRSEAMPDDPSVVALLYGPIVLAGELGVDGLPAPYARNQGEFNRVPPADVPVFVAKEGELLKRIRRVKAPGASALSAEGVARRQLARRILDDSELNAVLAKAQALTASGANAGSGYGEVWIRDLNTFIEMALGGGDRGSIRSNLLTFFKFQGADGNIPDGYIPTNKAGIDYKYIRSELAPGLVAHKNTVETDQESSLIQAIAKYIQVTGDAGILNERIGGEPVQSRLRRALEFLLSQRFDPHWGLIWGATTVDWGDVQPEHPWGVELDEGSHRAVDIYDNAMLLVALDDYLGLVKDDPAEVKQWTKVRAGLRENVRRHLWDARRQKFVPHRYLAGSPFGSSLDENAIHYHGGTAVAIEADLLAPKEVAAVLAQMRANVREAGAASIGLTVYPPYPEGAFKNPAMKPWSYQNGGDWCWFGGRMVQQLIRLGWVEEAYAELKPMAARVARHGDFYEWWSRDNQPRGSARFRGSAGVLGTAITRLQAWARAELAPVPSLAFQTRDLGRPRDVRLIPLYQLHHQRYSVYWRVMTPAQYGQAQARLAEAAAERRELERRTLDVVEIGDSASEARHEFSGEGSQSGSLGDRRWRDARGWFSYRLGVDPAQPTALRCTWWGGDSGGREFDILVEGRVIASEKLVGAQPGEFLERTYSMPRELTRDKAAVTVKLQARPGQIAGGLFGLRTVRED